ncbi:MAG: tRNA (adenosine(37)-N6)-threonylcarbamoyltransferase complex ATPase subunit type 1 TsaE [Ignavibacteriae bacterium]|nr:tRNA (adenosine(37)-N6)-threonylcarbamoyltransferase complex ATPase subunit type 1 TsaE [Ignavibacteria bacterium]MBI3364838.1 tRNA (adenosine(37)-N6)-threonylcarbamoyltransferase complex ATPase subunit type 1 TsaE [Ignavibacteriota bacterium]
MVLRETLSEDETIRYGEEFAGALLPGDVVAVIGDLGSGKTCFIKGICKGLGVTEHVASPTFTIVNEYHKGDLAVYHFDFYRVLSLREVHEIGFEEYLSSGDAICLIEWADRVLELLPPRRYDVRMRLGEKNQAREIVITAGAGITT